MISIHTHPQLYTKNHSASLEFARTIVPYRTKEKMQFHMYWRVPRDLNEKHLVCLKSIIASHEELNSGNYEINLWSNVDLTNNSVIKSISPFIKHRIWNPLEEMVGTPLEQHIDYFSSIVLDDSLCWLGIDLFKILSLYKYGGFFVDMDVFILRDMSPLSDVNFLYQWGECGSIPNAANPIGGPPTNELLCNGAVMMLKKESETAFKFLEQLRYIRPIPNSVCWGCYLYSQVKDENLYKLPCAWFNIELLGNHSPTYTHFKYDKTPYDPHDGCFSWHWHGSSGWDAVVETGSKFDILSKIINEKYNSLIGI